MRRLFAYSVPALLAGLAVLVIAGGVQASGGGDHGAGHHGISWFNWPSDEDPRVGVGFIILNFAILIVLLKKLLFRPLSTTNAETHDRIKQEIADATAARVQANDVLNELRNKLKVAESDIEDLIRNASEAAEAEGAQLVEQAKREALGILASAKATAEREAEKIKATIETEIVERAIVQAEATIRSSFGSADQDNMVKSCVEQVSTMPLASGVTP